jgi:outer membrane protein OmpA-like peptidoglycan-associated protein
MEVMMRLLERVGMRRASLALALVVAAGGCSSGARKGAVVGGAAGAATGAVIGRASGRTGTGAATGAVVGAAAGAIIGDYMERQKRELEQVPGADVVREGDNLRVTLENAILFDFDSYGLRSEARTSLSEMADVLIRYPETEILVTGHTDAIGTDRYNQNLSEHRADSVRDYLDAAGVARGRMRTRGMGESIPVATNSTEEGRQANRRVEVHITPNDELRARAQQQAQAERD